MLGSPNRPIRIYILVRQLGGKNLPHRGTISFWLYIVATDLVSVFLDVGNLQITYKTCQHVFLHFFYRTLIWLKLVKFHFRLLKK